MYLHAQGNYQKAHDLLIEMLQEDPTDQQTLKHIVRSLREIGEEQDAINHLTDYLQFN